MDVDSCWSASTIPQVLNHFFIFTNWQRSCWYFSSITNGTDATVSCLKGIGSDLPKNTKAEAASLVWSGAATGVVLKFLSACWVSISWLENAKVEAASLVVALWDRSSSSSDIHWPWWSIWSFPYSTKEENLLVKLSHTFELFSKK